MDGWRGSPRGEELVRSKNNKIEADDAADDAADAHGIERRR